MAKFRVVAVMRNAANPRSDGLRLRMCLNNELLDSHTPNGMSISLMTKTIGSTMNNRIPMSGFVP